MTRRPVAVVTGASAGIGAATARALAADGWHVVAGARRIDRIDALATEIDGTSIALDVTDQASVDRFVAGVVEVAGDARCRLLVNNAGGALGVESLAEAVDEKWRTMFETNVLGLVRMTRGLLPQLMASGDGHVVNVTSIAALQGYPGGSGYNAAKFGAHGVTESLRQEMLGQPVRVTEILPGLVETEFSVVRFGGDTERAAAVYAGLQPLIAEDVAECIRWAASLPSHVNIDSIVVKPRDQADAFRTHREGP
jgi:NADP-dependent 3-hydroxy acid dehydrogenase YdfG